MATIESQIKDEISYVNSMSFDDTKFEKRGDSINISIPN